MFYLSAIFASLTAAFLPMVTWAQDTNTTLLNPLGTNTLPTDVFARLAGGLNFATATIALVFTVIGGYRILAAAGNAENYEKGKKMVMYSIIGLLVTTASYTILSTTISALSGGAPPSFGTSNRLIDPLNITNLPATSMPIFILYGQRILGYLINALGAVSLLVFVYGGFLWLTAAGNEERLTKAKQTLQYAVIGLVLVLCSFTFIRFIYVPFYNMLKTGQPQQIGSVDPDAGSPTDVNKPGVCFRLKEGGKTGATCSVETYSSCSRTKTDGGDNYKKGEFYSQYQDCGLLGACVQKPPGTSFRNRTTEGRCRAEYDKLFKPIAPAVNGNCASPDTTEINGQCYAQVDYVYGKDVPLDKVACFRQPTGCRPAQQPPETCEPEFYNDCIQPTATCKRGEPYPTYSDCSGLGACIQRPPGKQLAKNRVAKEPCQSDTDEARKLFPAIGPAIAGSCQYYDRTGPTAIGGKCYAHVSFQAGIDWPIDDEGACIWKMPDGTSGCKDYPPKSLAINGHLGCDSENRIFKLVKGTTSTFYPILSCDEIGYCRQNSYGGHQDCKNGVVDGLCTPILFAPVGQPVPPWGCGGLGTSYTEIDGKCYVPQNKLTFAPGKSCPKQ